MRRLLNVLYVMADGAVLRRRGETVVVRVGGETKLRMPLRGLEGIVCMGRAVATPQLLHACAERDIAVSFISPSGRFWARVTGPVSGNVLLRRQQFRMADDPDAAAAIARATVIAKVANCRTSLLRHLRDHPKTPGSSEVEHAASQMRQILLQLERPLPLNMLRGLEGQAAVLYFSVLKHLIVAQTDSFTFDRRTRRPPTDRFNALLSFLYALLTHDACAALQAVGLDPQVGYLHACRPGRPALALDLIEELRPVIADRLALALVNRQQVRPQGFIQTPSGAVLMDEKTRRTVIAAYQQRKREEITHPYLGEKIPVGLILYAQAMLLARYIRGDLDAYPAFIWR